MKLKQTIEVTNDYMKRFASSIDRPKDTVYRRLKQIKEDFRSFYDG